MTDRQIRDLYFHERDENGAIVFPRPPMEPVEKQPATLEDDLNSLRAMRPYMRKSDYETAVKRLKEFYGRGDHDNTDQHTEPGP